MKKKIEIINVKILKDLYKKNINVSEFLKNELGLDYNSEEIIELMYESITWILGLIGSEGISIFAARLIELKAFDDKSP